ncbi:MAG: molecular chaperone DnaJ [Polymorphobacter sp.]|jgi:hypothetical protein
MGLALILAAALAWWLHKRGELLPNLARLGGSGMALLLALKLLEGGHLLGAGVAGLAGAWWWHKRRPRPGALRPDEARALTALGLPPGADAEAVQAAWRRAMATAHPDAGGSNAAASALTAARDLLLKRQQRP